MTDRSSQPDSGHSDSTPTTSEHAPTSSATVQLPPFRYDSQGPTTEVSPTGGAATPSRFPSSSTSDALPPSASSHNQLHPPSLPSTEARRFSSASPPPHLPFLTLQRPSNPHEPGALPPIAPLHPFDFATFDAGRRRGSITDPSLHVASTQQGGSPRGGGMVNGGGRSPTDLSSSSSSNPNSPTNPSFLPSSYPFPSNTERRTSINSITSNNSGGSNPSALNSFYSPSPLSSTNTQQPSRTSFFPPPHHHRDNSVSPTSTGRTPTPGEVGYRPVVDDPPSPKSGARPAGAASEERMSVDEGSRGEQLKLEGRFMPSLSGLPSRPPLPRHTSGSGGQPSRPWTPNDDSRTGPSAFGSMQGVVGSRPGSRDGAGATGEERDRFSNHLPQFDYSQRRHSIAVGYPAPNSAPPSAPPPPNWPQAALKRKMSHDRAAAAFPPPSHAPEGSEPTSPASFRVLLPPGSANSASPSIEGGPLKRRGSAFDSKMTSLTLSERPDGGHGGGLWADRRDSTASLWSNASHVSSSGGGYGTAGSTQTSYTGGGGGSGSDASGLVSAKGGYAWPGAGGGGGYHPPAGGRPCGGHGGAATDPHAGGPLSRSSSPVGGASTPANGSLGGPGSFDPHEGGRPVFRDLAGYSMNNTRSSSSARSSSTVVGSQPSQHLPNASKNSTPSSSVSPVPNAMAPPSSANFVPTHTATSSQGSYHQMSSHLAPPSAAGGDATGPDGETPYSRSPELRVSHKLAERKRRKEMKDLFDELRDHLPADRGMKSSKWEILSKAVDYITQIKSSCEAKDRELEALRHELASGGPPPPQVAHHHQAPPHDGRPSSRPSEHHHLQQQHQQQQQQPFHPHHPQQHYPPVSHQQQQQLPSSSLGTPGAYNPLGSVYSMGGPPGGNYHPAAPPQSSVRTSYMPPPGSQQQEGMEGRRA